MGGNKVLPDLVDTGEGYDVRLINAVAIPIETSTDKGPSTWQEKLLRAVGDGDVEATQGLLSGHSMAEILDVQDTSGWPLLAIAASRGHLPIVEMLLAAGFPIDATDAYNTTALYRSVGFRQDRVLRYLMEKGADITIINSEGNNVIHNSAYVTNDLATLEALKAGVDPTSPNNLGRIALLDMVLTQPAIVVEYLDSKVRILDNYVQWSRMLYDFTGIDYQDEKRTMQSPLEAILSSTGNSFILTHNLIKRYLEWQWELYAQRYFRWDFGMYLCVLTIITYIAISLKYKKLDYDEPLWMYTSGGLDVTRAGCEVLLVCFACYSLCMEYVELVSSGTFQMSVTSGGKVKHFLMTSIFRIAEDINQTGNVVVQIPRYFLDTWNIFNLTQVALIFAAMSVRISNMAEQKSVVDDDVEFRLCAIIVLMSWTNMLELAGVFRRTGPQLRVLYRMIRDLAYFAILYIIFFLAVSVALFMVLAGRTSLDGADASHGSIGLSMMSTFQITIASANFELYQQDWLACIIYIGWTLTSTLLLLSLLVAILSYDFERGVAKSEEEWLMVFTAYILRVQQRIGYSKITKLKNDDLDRCHREGGFHRPMSENRSRMPENKSGIANRMYIVWEDSNQWTHAFRKKMSQGVSYSNPEDLYTAEEYHGM